MKSITATTALLFLAQATHAFTCVRPATLHTTSWSSSTLKRRATISADELSTMSREEQFHALGVKEEELALGIEPEEVLEFLGT
jgi:hypothetical protein